MKVGCWDDGTVWKDENISEGKSKAQKEKVSKENGVKGDGRGVGNEALTERDSGVAANRMPRSPQAGKH